MSIDMGQNNRRYGKVIFYTKFYKKNGKGKGGKYLEKEEVFCGGEENRRRKRRKYLEQEINGDTDKPTDRPTNIEYSAIYLFEG